MKLVVVVVDVVVVVVGRLAAGTTAALAVVLVGYHRWYGWLAAGTIAALAVGWLFATLPLGKGAEEAASQCLWDVQLTPQPLWLLWESVVVGSQGSASRQGQGGVSWV